MPYLLQEQDPSLPPKSVPGLCFSTPSKIFLPKPSHYRAFGAENLPISRRAGTELPFWRYPTCNLVFNISKRTYIKQFKVAWAFIAETTEWLSVMSQATNNIQVPAAGPVANQKQWMFYLGRESHVPMYNTSRGVKCNNPVMKTSKKRCGTPVPNCASYWQSFPKEKYIVPNTTTPLHPTPLSFKDWYFKKFFGLALHQMSIKEAEEDSNHIKQPNSLILQSNA